MTSTDNNEVSKTPDIWEGVAPEQIALAYIQTALMPQHPSLDSEMDSIEKHLESKPEEKYQVAELAFLNDLYTTMASPKEVPERLRKFLVDGLASGFETDDPDLKRKRLGKISDFSGQIVFVGSFIKGKDLETFADKIKDKIDVEDPEINRFWTKLQGDITASKDDFNTYE